MLVQRCWADDAGPTGPQMKIFTLAPRSKPQAKAYGCSLPLLGRSTKLRKSQENSLCWKTPAGRARGFFHC
jgi:hypothetical protein